MDSLAEHAIDQPRRNLILGTAGHIDHGKSSLVRALTGVDPDRLPEEQRRGMTIDLGFADLTVEGYHFGMVDVPGHERFVRTMVAGAMGIDMVLLAVAADDSVMPQTVEHVEILDLLGVAHGVVAVTKTDVVDPDLVELVSAEVRELLSGTSLRSAEIVPVSSVTGRGLNELRQALVSQATMVAPKNEAGFFRMAIDRVFAIQGRGTVVTGSVYGGRVRAGDALELWPGGRPCRVRGMQTHGQDQDSLCVSQRAALNLIGVDRERIERGCELATPGMMTESSVCDVRLRLLSSNQRPVKSYSRVRLCAGTSERMAVMVFPERDAVVVPGASAFAQLRTVEPLVTSYGQRFILRDENGSRTMGGGQVLRCLGQRRWVDRAAELRGLERLLSGSDADRVEEILRTCGFERPGDLQLATRAGVAVERLPEIFLQLESGGRWVEIPGSGRWVTRSTIEAVFDRARHHLERFHRRYRDEVGCPVDVFTGWLDRRSARGLGRALLDEMKKSGEVKIVGSYVCLPQFAPTLSVQDEKFFEAMLELWHRRGFQPPTVDEAASALATKPDRLRRLVRMAVSTRQLVEVEHDLYLHVDIEAELRSRMNDLLRDGGSATVSAIREKLDSSRKYVVPFLEYLDRIGFTRREGDVRRLGVAQ